MMSDLRHAIVVAHYFGFDYLTQAAAFQGRRVPGQRSVRNPELAHMALTIVG